LVHSIIDILSIYKAVLRIRMIEEAIADRYSEQKMRCPTHLSVGQELVPVVISNALTNEDKVYSTHRAHAHYIAKGGDLNKLIAELHGKVTGCTAGRGGSMHLTDLNVGFIASTAIVANSIPLAVGNALHQKLNKQAALTVSYFGDGATEEGVFYESVNFALLKFLPVLFVCENNKYSVYSSLSVRQPKNRKIYKLAEGLGVRAFKADGNDVFDTFCATEQAVAYIRENKGPAFIEFDTYRHRAHCGPDFDDDLNYRPPKELNSWLNKDPIIRLEKELSTTPDWPKIQKQAKKKFESEIAQAFKLAEEAPYPDTSTNRDFLYAK